LKTFSTSIGILVSVSFAILLSYNLAALYNLREGNSSSNSYISITLSNFPSLSSSPLLNLLTPVKATKI
jgi:hypothetical protein